METELVIEGNATAGLVLFYSPRAYVSLGLSHEGKLIKHVRKSPGQLRPSRGGVIPYPGRRVRIRLRNDRQDASAYYEDGQGRWVKLERSDDISGFQHNVFGDFISVRPGIFATGGGKATFTYFKYRSLN